MQGYILDPLFCSAYVFKYIALYICAIKPFHHCEKLIYVTGQKKWHLIVSFNKTCLDKREKGKKFFDFDNPRSLEKALSGKELHRKLLLLTKKF